MALEDCLLIFVDLIHKELGKAGGETATAAAGAIQADGALPNSYFSNVEGDASQTGA